MANIRTNSQGFTGALLTLIIVAVVVIGGLAGYLAWTHQQKPAANSQHQTQQTTKSSTDNNQSNPNEFTVAELGFKMTLPDGIKDLRYVIAGSAAYFTTTTLLDKDGAHSQCTATDGAIGAITKTSQNPQGSGATTKVVGDFYLVYNTPQQGCSANISTNQLQLSQAQLLQQALRTASAAN